MHKQHAVLAGQPGRLVLDFAAKTTLRALPTREGVLRTGDEDVAVEDTRQIEVRMESIVSSKIGQFQPSR